MFIFQFCDPLIYKGKADKDCLVEKMNWAAVNKLEEYDPFKRPYDFHLYH